mgnify:CR=1 FL=1
MGIIYSYFNKDATQAEAKEARKAEAKEEDQAQEGREAKVYFQKPRISYQTKNKPKRKYSKTKRT